MSLASALCARFRRAQLMFLRGNDTNNYATKSWKSSFIEQDRKTIFTNQRDFLYFPAFIWAARIALLFSIDGYQIFIIEYCWEKNYSFTVRRLKYGFAGFSKSRATNFNARHVAPASIYAIPFCNLLRGGNWIFSSLARQRVDKHSDVNLRCRRVHRFHRGGVIFAFKCDLFLKGFATRMLATVKGGQPFSGFPRVEGHDGFR